MSSSTSFIIVGLHYRAQRPLDPGGGDWIGNCARKEKDECCGMWILRLRRPGQSKTM